MKQIIKITFLLMVFLLPLVAIAHDFEVDGIYYNITNENEVSVTYQGTDEFSAAYMGDIIIPNIVTYDGKTYSVTSVGVAAFENCSGLTNISIPNSVFSIGCGAFAFCTSLAGVTIGNSVNFIDIEAFTGCTALMRVNITDLAAWCNIEFSRVNSNPLEQAHHLYLNDEEVTDLVIPNSITSIKDFAFAGCSDITSVTIPDTVAFIGSGAFCYCSGLTGVSIPNSVSTIGSGAFIECTGLTSVSIGNSVMSIDNSAFYGCSNLMKVNITDLAAWCSIDFGSDANPLEVAHHLYLNDEEVIDLMIPNTVTFISDEAFSGCSSLVSVTIPESVTSIGKEVFKGCTALETLNYNAVSCSDFSSGLNNPFPYPVMITTIHLGDNVQRIPAFFACGSGITDLIIPNSVTAIGRGAFERCENLINIIIPSSITSIDGWTFAGCRGLTKIDIPNSVVSIGEYAFLECVGLNSIIIPNSVNTIDSCAFQACKGLSSIVIPKSITVLSNGLFYNCTGLSGVTIPNTITSIGDGVFADTYELKSITIPKSVTFIGEYAFINSAVRDVVCKAETPPTIGGDGAFDMIYNCTLYVPAASIEVYRTADHWNFGNILPIEGNIFDNYLSLPDTTVFHGDTIVIPVSMNNDEMIMAFQTDIYLPEGFSIVTDENDEYVITPSGRLTSDHIILADNLNDGGVRVICYTQSAQLIDGYDGDLFFITVATPADAGGDYSIYLRNSRLTKSDYTELRAPDEVAVLNVMTYTPGDVNDSRTITVTDIVLTAQYILQNDPEPFIFAAADMNGDGEVTVTDIMLIARLILYPTMNVPRQAPALTVNDDSMSGEAVTLKVGETRRVSILLDNVMAYSAFQFDLNLPDGLTASNFALTDRAGSHDLDVNTLTNGNIRALCYSPAIEAIDGNSGVLLTFDVMATQRVMGDITVDGIELVTTACQTVRLDAFTIGVNNVTAVNELATGKAIERVEYFNMAGQQLAKPTTGVNIVVTTYTDGTRTTTKIIQ